MTNPATRKQIVFEAAELLANELTRLGFTCPRDDSFERQPVVIRRSATHIGYSAYIETTRRSGESRWRITARISDHDCGPARWGDYHFIAVIKREGEADDRIKEFIADLRRAIEEHEAG